MAYSPHDLDLVAHLTVKNPILHKRTLRYLFSRDEVAVRLCGHFVDGSESSFADIAYDIVGFATIPAHAIRVRGGTGAEGRERSYLRLALTIACGEKLPNVSRTIKFQCILCTYRWRHHDIIRSGG